MADDRFSGRTIQMPAEYKNPIIGGFYPDPSVCRVGDDYFLVTSSFEYFPGIPIFHSRDLVHWEQLGNVLTRPLQLPLDGVEPSDGIWAATIRFHAGRFFVITTNATRGGNFIVTATDPSGLWSDPYWLSDPAGEIHAHYRPQAPGIDPSLFFDHDGKCYYTGNRIPRGGVREQGDREIWMQELNLETLQLGGSPQVIFHGERGGFMEGPHIYHREDYYYLLVADGGTGHDHSVVVARSRSIWGPYEKSRRNPILTHRHLGLKHPIVNVGHADLVETQRGEWWMVCLGSRPYGGYHRNLGRETFLVPVVWEEGWPVVSPGTGRIEASYPVPDLPAQPLKGNAGTRKSFGKTLGFDWLHLRTPREKIYDLSVRPGWLRLCLKPEKIAQLSSPAFIAKRQCHINFTLRTRLEFMPMTDYEEAGVVMFMNNLTHCRMTRTLRGTDQIIQLITVLDGMEKVVAVEKVTASILDLGIFGLGQEITFACYHCDSEVPLFRKAFDARQLSPDSAGGNTGVVIGLYASSNSTAAHNHADFAYFDYFSE